MSARHRYPRFCNRESNKARRDSFIIGNCWIVFSKFCCEVFFNKICLNLNLNYFWNWTFKLVEKHISLQAACWRHLRRKVFEHIWLWWLDSNIFMQCNDKHVFQRSHNTIIFDWGLPIRNVVHHQELLQNCSLLPPKAEWGKEKSIKTLNFYLHLLILFL